MRRAAASAAANASARRPTARPATARPAARAPAVPAPWPARARRTSSGVAADWLALRPRCRACASSSTAVAVNEELEGELFRPWSLRVRAGRPADLGLFRAELEGDAEAAASDAAEPEVGPRLDAAPARVVLDSAVSIADGIATAGASGADLLKLQAAWQPVLQRLRELELDSADAVLVLHCMVRTGCFDRKLMTKVADRIECLYFGTDELGSEGHAALGRFAGAATFKSMVCSLPLQHKVKLVLLDDFRRERGLARRRPPEPEADARTQWRTMDPVDMEMTEREQFEKGRIKIKRIRNVKAQENRMAPGKRLRGTLAFQLTQELQGASVGALAQLSQVFAFPKVRLLPGDLQDDFRESFCREVNKMDTRNLTLFIVALASAMRGFAGPEALRAWRRKLIPALLIVCRAPVERRYFERQLALHPRLQGVPVEKVPTLNVKKHPPAPDVRVRADRAARLYFAVASARQVELDFELADVVAQPLKAAVNEWLASPEAASGGDEPLLHFELVADVLGAAAASGVRDRGLASTLARLILAQHGGGVSEDEVAALSAKAPADLATAAHGLAMLAPSGSVQAPIQLLWKAALPGLRRAEPHYALMLLDAVVRAGSDELLVSPELLQAADEFAAQRLDMDLAALGRLGG
eukprot:TRINITY_DN25794_c0_g3_i1.p1 TRINITY_DN25794_c0_g3~~TRINITY_DN25794_c0_g3_i1.p1  ORF type:complete len:672 (-),score=147.26 TRINITY_DN25794_c0_g3_i1:23-1948(-)